MITTTYVLGTADDAKQVLESEIVKEIVGAEADTANVVDLANAKHSKSKMESEVKTSMATGQPFIFHQILEGTYIHADDQESLQKKYL